MFNGGQAGGQNAGDGGQIQLLYDTENHKKQGEVSGEKTSEAEKHKEPTEVDHVSKETPSEALKSL